MDKRVDLVWLGDPPVAAWDCGDVISALPTPAGVATAIAPYCAGLRAPDAVLTWHAALGAPDERAVQRALDLPGDLWHAGLRLGMNDLPHMLSFVSPTWMLNRDPDPAIEATSWRLSLHACLVRTEALRQMGGPRPEFETLAGAALEMGHRYITRGVITRHVPWLLTGDPAVDSPAPSLDDELRFLIYRFGRRWSYWVLMRALLTRSARPRQLFATWHRLRRTIRPADPPPFTAQTKRDRSAEIPAARVSVLIPTIDRYPYLRTLLGQLRQQTLRPQQIIVIDQTPIGFRDTAVLTAFSDLPLVVLYQDEPGQCSARNAGIFEATGDYVLFLDDDVEISPTFVADHLLSLQRSCADASSGVIREFGAESNLTSFTYSRVSDVFPAGNTLIRKDVLTRSGLFDLAYDRGQRADGDLGMRVYLSGALMVLNADIHVLHHHAPAGGLRTHRARVITYASSRRSLWQRHLPSVTEIYLGHRYFAPQHVREMLWLRAFGTLSARGSRLRRAAKLIVGLLLLPDTWRQISIRAREAATMSEAYPQISTLPGVPDLFPATL